MTRILYSLRTSLGSQGARRGNRCFRFLSCSAGILLALLLVTSTMEAQSCPNGTDFYPAVGSVIICTGYPNFTVPAWTGINTYTYTYGSCTLTVYYCIRYLTNWPTCGTHTMQIVIEGWQDNNDPTCVPPDQELGIIQQVIGPALGPGYVAPCGGNYTPYQIQTISPACWNCIQNNPNAFRGCNFPSVACIMTCDACYTYGHIQTTNCNFTVQGDDSGCITTLPVPWLSTDNNCYLIPCDSHP